MHRAPFRADVWGTVSDWFVFTVTTIGTIYIVRTFRQQRRINEMQSRLNEDQMQLNLVQKELNRLALEKDKREVFAAFRFKNLDTNSIIVDDIKVKIIVTENKALDVEFFPVINGKLAPPIGAISYVALPETKHVYEVTLRPSSSEEMDLQYVIYFTDQSGRPYTQDVGVQNNRPVILYPLPQTLEYRKTLPKNKWSD